MNSLTATLYHIPMAFGSLLSTLYDFNYYNNNSGIISQSNLIIITLIISLIYFVIDLVLMIKHYSPRNNIYVVHHLIGIISILISWFLLWNYARYVMYYTTFELSTLFYNLTLELHLRGYDTSNPIMFISQWSFIAIFTLVRIIFGTYITCSFIYEVIYDTNVSNYYIILPVGLQCLMYYWFASIIKKINKS